MAEKIQISETEPEGEAFAYIDIPVERMLDGLNKTKAKEAETKKRKLEEHYKQRCKDIEDGYQRMKFQLEESFDDMMRDFGEGKAYEMQCSSNFLANFSDVILFRTSMLNPGANKEDPFRELREISNTKDRKDFVANNYERFMNIQRGLSPDIAGAAVCYYEFVERFRRTCPHSMRALVKPPDHVIFYLEK